MKTLILTGLTCAMFALTGCTTKVYNHPPSGSTTVIEKDRPVVTEREVERPTHTDVHVDTH